MEISKGLTSAISELGFPIVVALVSIFILYKLGIIILKFVQDLVGKQQTDRMKNIEQIKIDTVKAIEQLQVELDEEQRDTRKEIAEIKTMVIRLIDRVRLLAEEVYDHDTTARAVWDIGNRKPKHRTRTERREQLQDELADIGKNGDDH
jgi:hypothetical protein|tara:strand:- start:12 stop:458 length:447 start_codon:yes stop_codon:yes gene_type:complete